MRLGIKAKQIAGVTAIVGLAIGALSAINLTRLSGVVLHESHARAQLLARAIFHRAREVVTAAPEPYSALRADPGLRAILEASIYGESIVDAAVFDASGFTVAASDPAQEKQPMRVRGDLDALMDASAWDQLRVIYSRQGQTLEVRQPMMLDDQVFGSIRIGVSTLLMRQELTASLQPALIAAAGALLISVLVAGLLAQLLLRPIHVLRSGLTRLGRGEFGVTLDLPPGDEFAELGAFFNSVSQQLSADRSLLAGQKANLQSAVEHLEDAVALFNPAGELLFSNPAMQPVLPADAIGRALRGLLPLGHPYAQIVEETLAARRSRGPVQARVDGDDELLVMAHAVEGTGGELVGVLLVARNLANLTRMQSTLAYSRKLVALGRLTAGIAHEVKNPLNAMMIHLELLRTKLRAAARQAVTPQVEPLVAPVAPTGGALAVARREQPAPVIAQGALEHVEVIESEIRRLDEVVQGFLKFSRPEDLRLQPVPPRTLFEEILPVIEPEAQRNAVTVHVDASPHVPAINGDAGMLRQVFLNLAINACQAMPNGGTLRLTSGAASRGRVELRVQDTGVGIPPDHLQKIFDLYFTTKDHGTGLGLSMVYRIVQLHDGEIEVQSTPGRGTTFRVLLPRANKI
ncbi:MAG: ATP-binding protein [Vicinamibacterales bacterium]